MDPRLRHDAQGPVGDQAAKASMGGVEPLVEGRRITDTGAVAGVPPDIFSASGQLWGNPLYDWPALRKTGYRWWIERFRRTFELVDIARVDHFRGFVSYWAIPAGALSPLAGRWRRGPGAALFAAVEAELGPLPLIAAVASTARTRNTMKRIFAAPAALAAMPPKPKTAATRAMTKKTAAQYNMIVLRGSRMREFATL